MNRFVMTFYRLLIQPHVVVAQFMPFSHLYATIEELRITSVLIGRRQVEFAEGWREGRI